MRPRFPRGKTKEEVDSIHRFLSDVPYGSPSAHPKLLRRFLVARIPGRYGSDVVRSYVRELGEHLGMYASTRNWISEQVMTALIFPEQILGMQRAEPYEIGACDSDLLERLYIRNPRRKEVCRFIFFRGQGRTYDAVETASHALIEIERVANPLASDSDIVKAVRKIEMVALRTALFSAKKRKT
ncbi:MAG: hypothetical protein HGA33_03020 [Candidatus Moranbacteria bacterium]|nr:hypothetical protein [Candidatus Moranbacteria bacterium]